MSTNDGGPAFPVSTMVEERTAGYGHQDGPATYRKSQRRRHGVRWTAGLAGKR